MNKNGVYVATYVKTNQLTALRLIDTVLGEVILSKLLILILIVVSSLYSFDFDVLGDVALMS